METMSVSHIITDEATGVTYMDTVTTSVESGPKWPGAGEPNQGAHHRGHHKPCMMS